jgi:hypothetical protein
MGSNDAGLVDSKQNEGWEGFKSIGERKDDPQPQ